jgi:hypothetical protein
MIGQVTRRLLAASLTFVVGLCAFALLGGSRTRPASPCGPDPDSVLTGRAHLRLRGMLYGGDDGRLTFNESECGGAWAAVEFDPSFAADLETREFVGRLNALAAGDRMSRAEVVMTGTWVRVVPRPAVNEPPFVFTVKGLEQAGPISLISQVSN